MNKISVIIPTIYKKPKILYTLIEVLSRDICVDEILLISNCKRNMQLPDTDKLKEYIPQANLYVNASWNLGIKLIKEENFLIINDDILVCEDFCSMIVNSENFSDTCTGLIGLNNSKIIRYHNSTEILPLPKKQNPIFLEYLSYKNLGDWGSAFFGKKENYYTIPDDLKIIFGDNYLVKKNIENNKKIYMVSNMFFNHVHSSTSASPEFKEIIMSDIENSKKYFDY